MNSSSLSGRLASWRARTFGMFNLNDGRWGRGASDNHSTSNGQDDPKGPQGNPPPGGPAGGPPDLDELWRDFNRKLGGLFGQGSGGRRPPGGPSPSSGGRDPQFNGRGMRLGLGVIVAVALAIWCAW